MSTIKKEHSFVSAYDSFMDKHLKTYGYFSKSQNELDNERESWKDYEYDFAALWGKKSSISSPTKSRLSLDIVNSDGEIHEQTQMVNYKRKNYKVLSQKFDVSMLNSEAAVRWPIEMQVLNERIHHSHSSPIAPEPLSLAAPGQQSLYRPRVEGKVVFSYPVICGKKFTKSYNGSKLSYPSNSRKSFSTNTLLFESRFESGNLAKVIQLNSTTFELYLRPDLYSDGHAQWFYFKVQNMKKGLNYRFSIVNLHKIAGLYDIGMKPVMYSDRLAETISVGWLKVGENISYSKNEYDPMTGENFTHTHTLSWTCQFPHDNDTVYFAHSYPYTYSNLQEYLLDLINDPIRSQWCNVDTLCRSLGGNHIYVVTIFSPIEGAHKKRVIVLTARVHPGETPSSWVMKGLIDFLTSDSAIAQTLREKFIFKLVPMLNPDGVIVGNNRYSLSGRDLNRTYKTLLKEVFPPTWHLRRMVRKLLEEYQVSLYCDLHGHSRKPNIFMYGCENPYDSPNYLREQIFPLVLGQNAPDMFSFPQCKFHMHKQREGTGRVVMWLMGVTNSFTLEVSFAGSTVGDRRGTQFSIADYTKMAEYICKAITEHFDDSRAKFYENQLAWRRSVLQELFDNGSTATEPISPKSIMARNESDSSVESVLTEDQIDDAIVKQTHKVINQIELDISCTAETLEYNSDVRKKKKKKRSCKSTPNKSLSTVPLKPNKTSSRPRATSSTVNTNIKLRLGKRKPPENTATATWQRYQRLFEPQNQEKCISTYNLLNMDSPRRVRLRSLLHLQRNIIAQATVLRDSSPLHKKLTRTILKETKAMSESLSKELQLINDADKRALKNNQVAKTVAKPNKPPILRPFVPKSKPTATIPFQLSIKSTISRLSYKGIMVP